MIKHAGLGCREVRILPQFIPRYWILSKSFKLWAAATHFVLILITSSSKEWQLMSCHSRHVNNVSLWFIVFSLTRTRHCLLLTSKFMVTRGKKLIITRLYNTTVWFLRSILYFHWQWSQCYDFLTFSPQIYTCTATGSWPVPQATLGVGWERSCSRLHWVRDHA